MISKEESNFIKLIAILTMLIDHIGAFIYPLELFTIIGRISFPLFAFQLTVGYKKTLNKKKYIKRLLFFAFISQIPHYLLRGDYTLNILFSLALGIFAISAIEKRNFLYIFLSLIASFVVEYGLYGLSTILIFYFFKKNIYKFGAFSLSSLIFLAFYQNYLQLFAIFSFAFIFGPKGEINLPKYLFYIFYPAHLAVIYILRLVFFL